MTASLEQVLAARDERAAAQAGLISRLGLPLVSLTLVSPGPLKDDERRRRAMDAAEAALVAALGAAGFPALERSRRDGPAGPESLYAVAAPPLALKALAVGLEDGLSWGRLLDVDVIVAPRPREPPSFGEAPGCAPLPDRLPESLPEPVSRSALGLPPRSCLLCGNDARLCMAERAHPMDELAAAAERLIDTATLG